MRRLYRGSYYSGGRWCRKGNSCEKDCVDVGVDVDCCGTDGGKDAVGGTAVDNGAVSTSEGATLTCAC